MTAEGPFRGRSSYLDLLYVVVDTYFTELEWVPIVQWTNLTDSDGTYPQTITTRFATCDSGLAAAHIGFASMMQDLRIRFENVYKSFLAQETTKPLTFDINLNVPPEKSAVICQRRWRFKHVIWFVSKSDQKESVVTTGPLFRNDPGSEARIERTMTSFIDSNQYFIDKEESLTVDAVKEVDITPAQELYSKEYKKVSISEIPQAHQNVIVKLLV